MSSGPQAGGRPYGPPVPPPRATPGSGNFGRSWLLFGGLGCGCAGILSLCAVMALFIVVIGPAVRGSSEETISESPPVAIASATPAAATPTARETPVPTRDAPPATSTALPATSTTIPSTPEQEVAKPSPAPLAPSAPPRTRPPGLPRPTEVVGIDGVRIGVLGLGSLDEQGRVSLDHLGATTFPPRQHGIGATFSLEQGPPEGSLSIAGVWVVRQGEKVSPLTDPATLELSAIDEGQPLLFRLTFRSGVIPPGEYAFGLFTVEHGQIDRLVKRLDFIVEQDEGRGTP